jgi:hypothetical protein
VKYISHLNSGATTLKKLNLRERINRASNLVMVCGSTKLIRETRDRLLAAKSPDEKLDICEAAGFAIAQRALKSGK